MTQQPAGQLLDSPVRQGDSTSDNLLIGEHIPREVLRSKSPGLQVQVVVSGGQGGRRAVTVNVALQPATPPPAAPHPTHHVTPRPRVLDTGTYPLDPHSP